MGEDEFSGDIQRRLAGDYDHPMATPRGKVLVAMSGGVDSAVAAGLLRADGYEVVGCFMRLGSEEQDDAESCTPTPARHQGCCSLNDAADARHVAALLDVPLYVLNFRQAFGRVMDYFVAEYHAGRTPNPCVRCNDWLKFGRLMDYADSIDAAYVATGHYARIDRSAGEPRLLRGLDRHKDQSYVLFGQPRARLARMMLPIGEHCKPAVREMARQMGLPVHDKPDSQEICFVPDNDYGALVRRRSGPGMVQPGPMVDAAGRVVGEHPGHQHFTVGQRRGLGVATGVPLYVLGRNAGNNTVTVGSRAELEATGLTARELNWLVDPVAVGGSRWVEVQIRSNGTAVGATLTRTGADHVTVHFDAPLLAVTPGQAAVWYDGDMCLGGGWIESATGRDNSQP